MKNPDLFLILLPAWGVEIPPLSLAILKAGGSKAGFNISCHDLNLICYQKSKKKYLWDKNSLHLWTNPKIFETEVLPEIKEELQVLVQKIRNSQCVLTGLSILESNLNSCLYFAKLFKTHAPEKILIAGGPQCTFKENRIKLSMDFDWIFVGEAEDKIGEIIKKFQDHSEIKIDGLYKNDGNFIELDYHQVNPKNFLIPDFQDFLPHSYMKTALPVLFSRSCIFQCQFCSDFLSMGKYRKLTKKQMSSTLMAIWKLGFRQLWFNDLLINGHLGELIEVLSEEKQKKRYFQWQALATPNRQFHDENTCHILKQLGLHTLNLGLESGSDLILKAMGKGFNLETARQSLGSLHKAKIKTQVNLIVGFPGETRETFAQTLQFLEENKEIISGFTSVNTCILLPGSRIHAHAEKLGIKLDKDKDPTKWSLGKNTAKFRNEILEKIKVWILQNKKDLYSCNLNM